MTKNIFFLIIVFSSAHLSAQNISGSRQSLNNAALEYLLESDIQSPLYYGNEQDAHRRATNHPYYDDRQYTVARLTYNRVIYPEVMLRWDLFRDELIVLSPDFRHIVLFAENVNVAELHNRNIIYFRRDENTPSSPSSGYYILLYSGSNRIMEKTVAHLMHRGSNEDLYYAMTTRFFLHNDDVYHIIKNRRGLLKVLKSHKRELKQYISANRLKYRKNAGEFIYMTVKEYENLKGLL